MSCKYSTKLVVHALQLREIYTAHTTITHNGALDFILQLEAIYKTLDVIDIWSFSIEKDLWNKQNNNIQVIKKTRTQWESNPRPKDSQTGSLTTVLLGQLALTYYFAVVLNFKKVVL